MKSFMQLTDFASLSLTILIPVFIGSAALVFWAGTRLSEVVNKISDRTGLGKAFAGTLFLGGITSLPEVATTIAASVQNFPGIAANNLLGGVAMQIAILALADAFIKKQTITSLSSQTVILLQGTALILSLSLLAGFILAPSFSIFHIGAGSVFIFLFFLASLYLVHRYRAIHWLKYAPGDKETLHQGVDLLQEQLSKVQEAKLSEKETTESLGNALRSKTGLWLLGLAVLIFAGGFIVVQASESIAEKTGLGANVAGFVLVAIATSLPEVSSVISAVKLRQYEMAFSNIFGTNLFDIALIFVADAFYLKGPILKETGNFSLFGIALANSLTCIYMVGLIVNPKKKFFTIGYDSLLVIIFYLAGVCLLFRING